MDIVKESRSCRDWESSALGWQSQCDVMDWSSIQHEQLPSRWEPSCAFSRHDGRIGIGSVGDNFSRHDGRTGSLLLAGIRELNIPDPRLCDNIALHSLFVPSRSR